MQEAEQALAVQREQNSSMLNKLLTAQVRVAPVPGAHSKDAVWARV
jgi:predicted solute-binding protein